MRGLAPYRAAAAGALYAAAVFAAGFVLGVLRVTVMAPLLGEALAVVAELPVILLAAWLVSGWITRRWAIPPRAGPRLVMGASALAVILAADLTLGLLLLGQPPHMIAARYATAAGLIGLAGQILFAAIPLIRVRTERPGPTGTAQ